MRWLFAIAIVLPLTQHPAESPKDKGSTEGNRTVDAGHPKPGKQDEQPSIKASPAPEQPTIEAESKRQALATNDKTGASGKQTSDEELGIQRKLAWFTGALVVVGFLQFFALVGQVTIYYRQANIMARQVEISGATVQATKAQNRAWLVLTHIETPHGTQKMKNGWVRWGTGFNWSVKNTGNSPAFILRIGARFHRVTSIADLPAIPDVETGVWAMPTSHYRHGMSVGPRQTVERYTLEHDQKVPSTPQDYADIRDGKCIWLAYGVIEYRTVFDAENISHETRFCYRWTPGNEDTFAPSDAPTEYTKQT